VRFIYNHGVSAGSNCLLPLVGFRNGSFIGIVRVIGTRDVQQSTEDKGKLLPRLNGRKKVLPLFRRVAM